MAGLACSVHAKQTKILDCHILLFRYIDISILLTKKTERDAHENVDDYLSG